MVTSEKRVLLILKLLTSLVLKPIPLILGRYFKDEDEDSTSRNKRRIYAK